MNFATLQGLTIPEGVVTQITDASGRVIWSAVKKVTITLDFTNAGMSGYLSAEVNGTQYKGGFGGGHNGKVYEISVPVGDKIVCTTGSAPYACTIVVNGTTVSSTKAGATYEYIVSRNVTIEFNASTLYITET